MAFTPLLSIPTTLFYPIISPLGLLNLTLYKTHVNTLQFPSQVGEVCFLYRFLLSEGTTWEDHPSRQYSLREGCDATEEPEMLKSNLNSWLSTFDRNFNLMIIVTPDPYLQLKHRVETTKELLVSVFVI